MHLIDRINKACFGVMQALFDKYFPIVWSILAILSVGAVIILFLAGCGPAITTIKDPEGKVYEIVSRKDALVKVSMNNKVSLTIDNRGPRSSLQTILDAWALKYISSEEVK